MPDFTYREISDEMTRLGYTYPSDDDFSEAEITSAIASLGEHYLTAAVATLTLASIPADVLAAFSKLAGTLHGEITTTHDSLTVTRATTPAERRESALAHLKSARADDNREAARLSLANRREPTL